jgi:hypothetical protein
MWGHLDGQQQLNQRGSGGGGANQNQQMGGGGGGNVQQMGGQPQAQQQSAAAGGWGGANMMSGMMMGGGEDMAKQFAGAQTAQMAERAGACAKMLKPYFRVSNRYVLKKFEMVLFPCRRVFKKETWKREEEKEPLADANAPDLYLPLMACITFVLIIGWLEGKGGQFTPDVLGHIMSISLALLAVEVVAIYVAVRAVKGVPLGWFDTIAYCGYKYVPLCINVLCGVTFGYYGYLGATLATGASYALFSFHTFSAAAFAPAGDAAQFPPAVAATHKLVAIIIAAIEFL